MLTNETFFFWNNRPEATGVSLVVPISFFAGEATGEASAQGIILSVVSSVLEGQSNGAAAAQGALFTVTSSLIEGSASQGIPASVSGSTFVISSSLIPAKAGGFLITGLSNQYISSSRSSRSVRVIKENNVVKVES